MKVSELGSTALFSQYIDVLNRAVDKHGDEFPFETLLEAADDYFEDKQIGVGIYKSDADAPHDWFTLSYDDGTFGIGSHGKDDTDIDWKVSRAYLERVVENSDEYVENPAKLDFAWLKSKVGLD